MPANQKIKPQQKTYNNEKQSLMANIKKDEIRRKAGCKLI